MKAPVYNLLGEKVKDIELDSSIFNVAVRPDVVHQVVVAQQANSRQVLAHTKDKSDVRGGGRKPWKQKGTGRARHGSTRSPLWVGGGVTFGPTSDRNFSKKINQKQKKLALAMCLSDRVNNNSLTIFDKLEIKDGKTKILSDWLKEAKTKIDSLKNSKKVLLILESNDKMMIQAAMNLDKINTILVDSLNCVDLLKYDAVAVSEAGIKKIGSHYFKNDQKVVK